MAKWVLSPGKIWDAYKEATKAAKEPAALVFAGDPTLVSRASEVLPSEGAVSRLVPGALGEGGLPSLSVGEILVVFVHPHEEDVALDYLGDRRGHGSVVVVDDGPAHTGEVRVVAPGVERVSFSDTESGWASVRTAILNVAEGRLVALGRRYPSLRSGAAARIIERTARQNAVIGTAFFIPGTDMPVMTANQMKMVFSLAALHGQEVNQERAVELLGVVGAGFGFRAIARQALVFVPGPGWAYKGAIGYSGTRAIGEAALRYFQQGAPASLGRVTSLVKRFRR